MKEVVIFFGTITVVLLIFIMMMNTTKNFPDGYHSYTIGKKGIVCIDGIEYIEKRSGYGYSLTPHLSHDSNNYPTVITCETVGN